MDIESRRDPLAHRERPRLRGLYAITPDLHDTDELVARVEAALRGGAAAVQYRNKTADAALARVQAAALVHLCRSHQVPLIVNDDWRLALAVGAAGVHVGIDDGDPCAVRAQIGPELILGVSCYNRIEHAEAVAGVADYVAFGSVFGSVTKPQAARASLELFEHANAHGWNSVAIGGIDSSNAARAFAAGADAVALITAVLGLASTADIERAARTITTAGNARADSDRNRATNSPS